MLKHIKKQAVNEFLTLKKKSYRNSPAIIGFL